MYQLNFRRNRPGRIKGRDRRRKGFEPSDADMPHTVNWPTYVREKEDEETVVGHQQMSHETADLFVKGEERVHIQDLNTKVGCLHHADAKKLKNMR
jgi:hypothetical protein